MFDAVSGGKRMRDDTAASMATGWQLFIGPTIALNIVLFGYVLFEPLLITRISFIRRNEIILVQAAYDLYGTDKLLFLVVFLFGIAAPSLKMMATTIVWYFVDVRLAERHHKWLTVLGKLSMLDIMLLALLVIAIKGTGVGSVEPRLGLYVYVVLILSSFFLSLAIDQLLDRFGNLARRDLADTASSKSEQ
jgi:paraquat-inducible protein A